MRPAAETGARTGCVVIGGDRGRIAVGRATIVTRVTVAVLWVTDVSLEPTQPCLYDRVRLIFVATSATVRR